MDKVTLSSKFDSFSDHWSPKIIVPRGVEHRPVADEEVEVVLFEPAGTLNTGSVQSDRTVAEPARI